ncbi:hypothetical protein CYMTET_7174 [Cymbomonas tetramitiformis]|uniref:EF-hand domain-containing protein n=1 Tax=Cymbomonas tetramitiformis TaxID=36881 RepID=A0AAE0GVY5_9CHLO|nr:hypothetical protein CYMTET_7174 [Cymbomonas tetramitiformis]
MPKNKVGKLDTLLKLPPDLQEKVSNLSELQLAEFKECFLLFDSNGSGSIEAAELGQIMRSMGANMTETELRKAFHDMDSNHSGEVDFIEFCALMITQMTTCGEQSEVAEIFNLFKNGAGVVAKEDLRTAVAMLCKEITEKQVDDMLQGFESNVITEEQFVTLFCSMEVADD